MEQYALNIDQFIRMALRAKMVLKFTAPPLSHASHLGINQTAWNRCVLLKEEGIFYSTIAGGNQGTDVLLRIGSPSLQKADNSTRIADV